MDLAAERAAERKKDSTLMFAAVKNHIEVTSVSLQAAGVPNKESPH